MPYERETEPDPHLTVPWPAVGDVVSVGLTPPVLLGGRELRAEARVLAVHGRLATVVMSGDFRAEVATSFLAPWEG
ncbi:hypothetical protein ACWEQL_18995 [Kitasatospora sp. NPDC004240]